MIHVFEIEIKTRGPTFKQGYEKYAFSSIANETKSIVSALVVKLHAHHHHTVLLLLFFFLFFFLLFFYLGGGVCVWGGGVVFQNI